MWRHAAFCFIPRCLGNDSGHFLFSPGYEKNIVWLLAKSFPGYASFCSLHYWKFTALPPWLASALLLPGSVQCLFHSALSGSEHRDHYPWESLVGLLVLPDPHAALSTPMLLMAVSLSLNTVCSLIYRLAVWHDTVSKAKLQALSHEGQLSGQRTGT